MLKYLYLLFGVSMGYSSNSTDCANVIQFALGLKMDVVNPTLLNQLKLDCCTPIVIPAETKLYVTCDSNNRVTEIRWYEMNLNGTINGTAIPIALTYISLASNLLTGSIPNSLPSSLKYLFLSDNLLTGSIPSNLPPGLTHLYVRGNFMTGDLPIFPNSLQYLRLGFPGMRFNHFTGILRLNAPLELYINDNWISGIVIYDYSRLTSANCDLSNNPLFGNPHISNLTFCIQLSLYNASSLPITVSTAQSSVFTSLSRISSKFNLPIASFIKTTSKVSLITIFERTLTKTISIYSQPLATRSPITSSLILNQNNESISRNHFSIIPTFEPIATELILNALKTTTFSVAKGIDSDTSSTGPDIASSFLIFGAVCGLIFLCILVVACGFIIKHPTIKSKFGRKNSYGTLNTVNTNITVRTK